MQRSRVHSGSNDMMRWLRRTNVLAYITVDSWMDLREPILGDDPQFHMMSHILSDQHHAQVTDMRLYAPQKLVMQKPAKHSAPTPDDMLAEWDVRKREAHALEFCLNNMRGQCLQ